ncbi:MAG: metallophosphoesterase family protein [Oligoflexia bacterium]|nr:metallophosphoesterase family protein [Oligoflexia bacterium]
MRLSKQKLITSILAGIFFLSVILPLYFLFSNVYAMKIGIMGDIHGDTQRDIQAYEKALLQMRRQSISEIILTGDYGKIDLKLVKKSLGWFVHNSKNKIHIVMGEKDQYQYERQYFTKTNLGHNSNSDPVVYLKQFGEVVNPEGSFESKIIEIDGRKILVSHFPQHKIPLFAGAVSEVDFDKRIPRQPMIIDTMAFAQYPNASVIDLEIFAHTHKMTNYIYEDKDGKRVRVINAGAIGATSGVFATPLTSTYAIYDTTINKVNFYSVETSERISVPTSTSKQSLIFKPSKGDSFWISAMEKRREKPSQMLFEIHKANKIRSNLEKLRGDMIVPVVCPIPIDGF